MGGANARIEDTDAVVVRSSRCVNGAEDVRVPLLQRGVGMMVSLLSAVEAHAVKGNSRDEESEEDNDGSLPLGGGKR
jgi:hypothetical protein